MTSDSVVQLTKHSKPWANTAVAASSARNQEWLGKEVTIFGKQHCVSPSLRIHFHVHPLTSHPVNISPASTQPAKSFWPGMEGTEPTAPSQGLCVLSDHSCCQMSTQAVETQKIHSLYPTISPASTTAAQGLLMGESKQNPDSCLDAGWITWQVLESSLEVLLLSGGEQRSSWCSEANPNVLWGHCPVGPLSWDIFLVPPPFQSHSLHSYVTFGHQHKLFVTAGFQQQLSPPFHQQYFQQ